MQQFIPKKNSLFEKFFLFLPWGFFWSHNGITIKDYTRIKIGFSLTQDCARIQKTFEAAVAKSELAKQKGLSDRLLALNPNEAMIFPYTQEKSLRFWMKNTYIPLQIAFFNSQGRLVNLLEMNVEEDPTQPIQNYTSSKNASVAVEMPPKALTSSSLYLCVEPSSSQTIRSDTK